MAIVDELIARLGYEVDGEENLRRFQRGLDRVEKAGNRVATGLNRVGKAAAVAVGTGFVALTKTVIDTTAKFETYATTLETVEGSAEKAQESLSWIAKFGATTPYEIDGITQAFVRLKAFGVEPMDGTLKTLGDTASAMGRSLDDTVRMFTGAMTGEFEALKGYGVVAKTVGDDVQFSWSENGKQVTETVKKNGEEIRGFLLRNFSGRFNDAMIRQSATFSGMMSNLGDAWTMFQLQIGQSGIFTNLKDRLADLMTYINRIADDGTLERWGQSISNGMEFVVDEIMRVGGNIKNAIDILRDNTSGFGEAWENLKLPALAIFMRIFPVISLFIALGLAIDDLTSYLNGAPSAIGEFIDALAEFLGVEPERVAEALGKIAQAAITLGGAAAGMALMAGSIRAVATSLGLVWLARKGAELLGAIGGGFATGVGEGLAEAEGDKPKKSGRERDEKGRFKKRGEAPKTTGSGRGKSPGGKLGKALKGGAVAGGLVVGTLNLIQGLGDTPGETFDKQVENQAAAREGLLKIGEKIKDFFVKPEMQGPKQPPQPPKLDFSIIEQGLNNVNGNLQKMSAQEQLPEINNDNRQDNRQFPIATTVTVNQTVTQPSAAPASVAKATGNAAASAVNQRSRVAIGPSF